MVSLITSSKARLQIAANLKQLRVSKGLTQEGLAERSGVSLPTLRKFEQKGLISFESFLKLCMPLGCIDKIIQSTTPVEASFASIDDVLEDDKPSRTRQRGWRK